MKDCLDTEWVSSVGLYVDRFERDVASACGVAHAVALVKGTAALQLALQVVGVATGDEVIVPAVTFVATANAVCHAGAVPPFVDSGARALGLDAHALSRHLDAVAEERRGQIFNRETGAWIAAILPMHVFGHPTDMDPLMDIAAVHGLQVVEDAAEALGSRYHGRPCSGLGRIYVFDRARFVQEPQVLHTGTLICEMTCENSTDIDTELDFVIAELIFERKALE